jgi:tRNA A-37 threonylcarbamoyl transferase component Bud32
MNIKIPLYVARFVEQLMIIVDTRRTLKILRGIKVVHKRPGSAESVVSACLGRIDLKSQVPVASGHFGDVYRIAKKSGDLAVKVMNMDPMKANYWDARGSLDQRAKSLINEVKVATLAGDIGVGPQVHDAFVCVRGDIPYGVTVMDFVDGGIKLSEWRTVASKADVIAAEKLVVAKLAKLHATGVIHGDLNAGNVMVVPKQPKQPKKGKTKEVGPRGVSDVWIIDYGFSMQVSDSDEWKADREKRDLYELKNLVEERKDTKRENIARRLVVNGYIKLPSTFANLGASLPPDRHET